MIKSQLVDRIASQNLNLYRRDLEDAVNAILDAIVIGMARCDRVEIRGFGIFTIRQRLARNGRNPRTGVLVSVERKFMPHFKAGKDMRLRLNRPET